MQHRLLFMTFMSKQDRQLEDNYLLIVHLNSCHLVQFWQNQTKSCRFPRNSFSSDSSGATVFLPHRANTDTTLLEALVVLLCPPERREAQKNQNQDWLKETVRLCCSWIRGFLNGPGCSGTPPSLSEIDAQLKFLIVALMEKLRMFRLMWFGSHMVLLANVTWRP